MTAFVTVRFVNFFSIKKYLSVYLSTSYLSWCSQNWYSSDWV